MSEIKGKGIPTRQTKGAMGDIYVDTATGMKYKCTGSYSITTHANSTKDYEWKPVKPVLKNAQKPAEPKPHESAKQQVETKVEEKVEEKVVDNKAQDVKKETKSNDKHNYTKHFDNAKDAE